MTEALQKIKITGFLNYLNLSKDEDFLGVVEALWHYTNKPASASQINKDLFVTEYLGIDRGTSLQLKVMGKEELIGCLKALME